MEGKQTWSGLWLCCLLVTTVTASAPVAIRLADGSKWYEGFLEHSVDGSWLRVCGTSLDDKGTSVVCRQLGFPTNNSTLSLRPLDSVTTRLSNSSFSCNGSETSLSSCPSRRLDQCSQGQVVFVECQANVRLVGGTQAYEGRLEVYDQDTWGTMCAGGFNELTASIVCRQLGYLGSAYYSTNSDWYGRFSGSFGPMFRCHGNESELMQCPTSGSCYHYNNQPIVICKTGQVIPNSVRLVNGSTATEGRLQLFRHGVWGTVCGTRWNEASSDVVCRTLFGETFSGSLVSKDSHVSLYGSQKTGAVFDRITCSGSESTLAECSGGTSFTSCSHDWDVAIKCSLPDKELGVQLLNGSVDGSGVVHFLSNGQLMKACATNWTLQDAVVVCRQLGYPTDAVKTAINASGFTERLGQTFNCVGTETSMRQCPSPIQQCTNTSDVFVSCPANIRLVGGPTAYIGRLEVYDDGKWYTLCNGYFGWHEKNVVCKHLGYQPNGVIHPPGAYGQQTQHTFSYYFDCNGQEASLHECAKNFYPRSCSSSSNIAVACIPDSTSTTSPPQTRLTGGKSMYEGWLEVFYIGVWSTVCDRYWTSISSNVACQSMFGSNFTGKLVWRQERTPLFNKTNLSTVQLLEGISCSSNDENILDCSKRTDVSFSCSQSTAVALQCTKQAVRLVNGTLDGRGTVEYLSQFRWASVCAEGWTNEDSTVVCRHLGYPTNGSTFTNRQALFTDMHALKFACNGDEESLANCTIQSVSQCDKIVVVHCKARMRLAGGSSDNVGRFEIYRWGSWYIERSFSGNGNFICKNIGYNSQGRRFYPYYSKSAVYDNLTPDSAESYFSCQSNDVYLSECTETYDGSRYSRYSDYGYSCDTGTSPSKTVRLTNGTGPHDGRLEAFISGSWSTVCDRLWSQSMVDVACRSLFGSSFKGNILLSHERNRLYGSAYSQYNLPILLEYVRCSGNEASLLNCSYSTSSCYHSSDIALVCNTSAVRLVNGTVEGSGVVQYLSGGHWLNVCYRNWDDENAKVVCRELGFPASSVEDISNDYRGIPSQPMVSQSFHCVGSEKSLSDCKTSQLDLQRCLNTIPVAIRCTAKVRLQDGPQKNEGRLEIYHSDGVWYRVRDYGFRQSAASVVCNQLGYKTTGALYYTSRTFGLGTGPQFPYVINNYQCDLQRATDLRFCRWYRSSSGSDVGVSCDTGEQVKPSTRLQDGASPTEGVLRVFSNGVWGSVCGTGWTDANSHVACREMFGSGFTGSRTPLRRITSEKGVILIDNVRCNGEEKTLMDCSRSLPARDTCDRTQDVALKCFASMHNDCGQLLEAESGTFTSPGFPEPYMSATDCVWVIDASRTDDKIHIAFSYVNISETQCATNHIEVLDNEKGTVMASYCGTGIPQPLMSEGSVLIIRLISTYDTFGNSFNASWTTVCRNRLTESSGTLQSPGYPSSPPAGKGCTYLIERPPGELITLNFDRFELGGDASNCDSNYVEVYDGPSENAPRIGTRLCGSNVPSQLKSSQYMMWIKFQNTDLQSPGFQARYTSAFPVCRPDATLTDPSGTITSPGHPYPYPNNTLCSWTVVAEDGMKIKLDFSSVKTYGLGRSCFGQSVSVYDVTPDGNSTLIDTFCGVLGARDIQPITSSSNRLKIVFKSALYYPFYWEKHHLNGFEAHYFTYKPKDIQHPLFSTISQENMVLLQLGNDRTSALPQLETGIPFGNTRQYNAYVSANGFLTFGADYQWPELIENKAMICAYASYIDVTSGSSISYGMFNDPNKDETVLNKATEEVRDFTGSQDFTARSALVVSWKDVKQRAEDGSSIKEGGATFETVVISDGRTSYSLINHMAGAMNWKRTSDWPYVTIGVSDGVANEAKEPLYSRTFHAYNIDTLQGNTGRLGSWMYKLGEAELTPEEKCSYWFSRNVQQHSPRAGIFSTLPQCPCSRRDVWRRARFTWTLYRSDNDGKVHCYRLTRTASQRFYPYSKECCYGSDGGNSRTFDQVILDAPYAGSALAFNPAYWALRDGHQRDDRQGHEACCVKSSDKFCKFFYYLRPVGECQANIPFRFSWMFGDPHITTLDDYHYTFNGWGEYTLVSIATPSLNFTLQGRTGLATTATGGLTNATVFTAFGAEENGKRVFVGLDPNTENSFIIYGGDVAETDISVNFRKDNFQEEEDAFTMSKDNGSLAVSFHSGITFTVTIGMKSLDIAVVMPLTYQTQTKGLLGNFNGNPLDDFVLPDGTVLSSNLTERQIFESFGKHSFIIYAGETDYSVDFRKDDFQVEEDAFTLRKDDGSLAVSFVSGDVTNPDAVTKSIMHYDLREGPEDFAHPQFTPIFLDEHPAEARQEAERVCGGPSNLACVYDFVATRNEAFSKATGQTKDIATEAVKKSANTIPLVVVPSNISVAEGEMVTIAVQGIDGDGDQLTFHLTEDVGGTRSIDQQTGVIKANFSVSNPFSLGVYAVDVHGAQSPVMVVGVWLCTACSGNGACDETTPLPYGRDPNFQRLACLCSPGYTGLDCEVELDACEDNPCLPGQTCVDFTAQQQQEIGVGYNCTSCPNGFKFQASICVDVDECASNATNECSQTCNNTAGSYVCGCRPGFRLSADGRTCVDVNECWEKVDGCNQTCVNLEGSFECHCWEGYDLAVDEKGCVLTASSPSSACQSRACSQGCRPVASGVSSGAAAAECFCYSGYQLRQDGVTCDDVNECQLGLCSQVCLNGEGDFACSCRKGYRLDQRDNRTCLACTGLKYGLECRLTCACGGRGKKCDPVTGCVCQEGWTGSQCEEDVDECADYPDVCDEGQNCLNTRGSYRCNCPAGFTETSTGACVDIDECADGSELNTCGQLELCSNVIGSFYCTCNAGYQKNNNTCLDIDECHYSGGNCQQKCINVPGSYNCDCNYGYRLLPDRATCVQVKDVCGELEHLNCSQGCSIGEDDSAFCFCNTGYTLASNNQTCADVDECSLGLANCTHSCENEAGGFRCSCPAGMKLDNDLQTCLDCPAGTWGQDCSKECSCGQGRCNATSGCVCDPGWTGARCDQDINECNDAQVLEECREKNAVCFNYRGGHRCRCRQGYAADAEGVCNDTDECLSSPCAQKCQNSEGSYQCQCETGFVLNTDGRNCDDVDECALFTANRCTQRCDNTAGSYRCSCNVTGYTLANDGFTCQAPGTCSGKCDSSRGGCLFKNGTETCFCNSGYSLDSDNVTCLEADIDLCGQNPCQHNCTEADYGRSFVCSCRAGYVLNEDKRTCRECLQGTYGEGCNQTCTCSALNTASCNSITGQCICDPGWQGDTCSDDINECLTSQICPDHSLCSNTNGSYLCHCLDGFNKAGAICEDIDECKEDPGVCSHDCVNENGTFHCTCRSGYTLLADNSTCQDIDECKEDPGVCSHDCVNENGTFHCTCRSGYTLLADNSTCQDIDECKEDPGVCSHDCVNENGTFHCTCRSGYTLLADNSTCQDIDECKEDPGVCSHDCVNENGTFHCTCRSGYTLLADNSTCQDIDECKEDPGVCSHDCVNENGTFHCTCRSGYTLLADNSTCQDIDECKENPGVCSHDCVNENGTFHCTCRSGYTLLADNSTCQDIDECKEDPGVCSHDCVNENGTFHCTCRSGYTLLADNSTCQDIDECKEDPDVCSHDCVNENGTFHCICPSGYALLADNSTCQDIEECKQDPGVCSHGCVNENGTFHCTCRSGYTLLADNRTCQDIDECKQDPGLCGHDCVNENGTFHCTCLSGYTLLADNSTCQDIDECKQDPAVCGHDCVNENGTFHCTCRSGYTLLADNSTCQDIDECKQDSGVCSHDCVNENGTFHCTCRSGYTLLADNSTCQDIDECKQDPGVCSHGCVNENGTFHCTCRNGYTLLADNSTCQESASLKFIMTINVDLAFDENDPKSSEYMLIQQEVTQILTESMRATVTGFLSVTILSIRKGSVECDCRVNVTKETETEAASDVTSVLRNISENTLTVRQTTGSAAVKLGVVQLGPDTSVCDALVGMGSCNQPSEQCDERADGRPVCRTVPPQDSKSSMWKVAVGLGLGLSITLVVVVLLVCRVRQWKKANKKDVTQTQHSAGKSVPQLYLSQDTYGSADPTVPCKTERNPVFSRNVPLQGIGPSDFAFYNGAYAHYEQDEYYPPPRSQLTGRSKHY